MKSRLIGTLCFAAVSTLPAALPRQEDIFTIHSFGSSEENYVSPDYVFSALSFYQELSADDYERTAPWSRNAHTQQGAIVLRDKTVLFFNTQSAGFLSVTDVASQSGFYRLAKTPPTHRICPRPPQNLDALPFPTPGDVFCAAKFPWNPAKHFTPQTLVAALPRFRPLTEHDVPERAILTASNNERQIYPKTWLLASREKNAEPLNGVLVLTNRAVLKWFTWTPDAIVFENYRKNTYFVISR